MLVHLLMVSDPTGTLHLKISKGGSWEVVFLISTFPLPLLPDSYDLLGWENFDVENLGW